MDERERRRAARRRRAGKDYPAEDLGNGVVMATADAVIRAVGSLPPDLSWEELAPAVIPVLPRRRPLPQLSGEPFRATLPPGIPVGFGIDIGPAFLMVGGALLEDWPVGPADVVARGLANLRERVRSVRARDLLCVMIEGAPARVLQTGLGCASALVLAPDELRRIFGEADQCLLAPMRDVLISLPGDVDRDLAGRLNDELAAIDPNGLALDAFVLVGEAIRYERLPRPGARAAAAR